MRRRRILAPVLATATVLLAIASGAAPSGAQATGAALTITSVSPWVSPDGVFQVRFAPSTQVPLDAVFTYTVHQRLRPEGKQSVRTVLDDVIDGGSRRGVLQSPVSAPVLTLGNPAEGLVLDIPVRTTRGGSGRVLLPTSGVHPVELELSDASGRQLWRQVVFLNRLPDAAPAGGRTPAPVSVTMVLPVDGPPALAPDGRPAPDAATQANVAGAGALLAALPTAPLVVAARPNVLSAVTRSDSASDRRFLAALTAPTRTGTVARWPYVAIDTGGLVAAGASDDVLRQVALGDQVLQTVTGAAPDPVTWLLDDTLSTESLPLVKNLGARRVIVSPERLRVAPGTPEDLTRSAAVGLQGEPGLTATAYDARLSFRLGAADVDPALRANQVVTALMTSWFDAVDSPGPDGSPPSAVIVVPPATDPAAVQALVPALTAGGPLSTDPADAPTRPTTQGGKEVIAALAPRSVPDQDAIVEASDSSRERISGFRSMAPTDAAETDTWVQLNAQTLARDMSATDRSTTHARIDTSVDERVAAIHPPRSRRVVLTSREATIPLRFRNDLSYDVRLVMRTKSPRLEFSGGDTREIVLKPGENRIDLPVVVRAPGPALLRIDLRSPDGSIRLPTSTVPVSASTISGVGAALSIVSLLFLAGWWISTTRRKRRAAARLRRRHPAVMPDDDPPPEPAAAAVGGDSRSGPDPTGSVEPGG